jgi:dephospho-CoA kinase
MTRLGITGGIGSGKSTVCNIFAHMGIPVYHADERAKWLVNNDPAIQQQIISSFGERSFEGGSYNRVYIASLVFNDKEKLQKLNAIIHPAVLNDWKDFYEQHQSFPYVIKEAAIMLETGGRETVDKIALVYSPLELRIIRLMERDGLDSPAIEARINSQMPEEEKKKLADFIIYNDDEHSLIQQVHNIHQLMLGGS